MKIKERILTIQSELEVLKRIFIRRSDSALDEKIGKRVYAKK